AYVLGADRRGAVLRGVVAGLPRQVGQFAQSRGKLLLVAGEPRGLLDQPRQTAAVDRTFVAGNTVLQEAGVGANILRRPVQQAGEVGPYFKQLAEVGV